MTLLSIVFAFGIPSWLTIIIITHRRSSVANTAIAH